MRERERENFHAEKSVHAHGKKLDSKWRIKSKTQTAENQVTRRTSYKT